jgi:vacuolar-type H+-ATPase subunit F/Vma7
MRRVAVLGETPRVDCWALAGAVVVPAAGAEAVRQAWEALAGDVEVVILTPEAARILGKRTTDRLVAVLP